MSIAVLVPSRGRPDRFADMVRSVKATSSAAVTVIGIIDADDPEIERYANLPFLGPGFWLRVLPQRVGYTASLNAVAREEWDAHTILGAFGDDVLFRTPGWDVVVERTLATPGLAYGDDLIHGVNHPSAVFMSSVIAKALDWLALPATSHQWADDGWKRLGKETGLLRYMAEVVVEHMHPAVKKAEWDATYASVFDGARAKGDHDGFDAWAAGPGLVDAIARVRAVL